MATNRKYSERANVKSRQYAVSTKPETNSVSRKSASQIYEVRGPKEATKNNKGTPNIIAMIPHHGSNHQRTTIIGEEAARPEWQMTAAEKMDMVREGVSKKKLESLKSKINLDYDKLSTILSTTRATLINKKGTEHFSAALSERIVSIADLYSYGFEVFEDETKFNEWIFRPNQALGGRPPFELLDNQFGREEVKNVIGRIDYGVYS